MNLSHTPSLTITTGKASHKDLIKACTEGEVILVEKILKDNPDLSQNTLAKALRWAGYHGQLEVIRRLLRAGANPRHVMQDTAIDRALELLQ